MSGPLTTPLRPPSTKAPNLSSEFLAQSRVGDIHAAVITVSGLCTIAVALRFICRRLVKAQLWWDDWTILAALVSNEFSMRGKTCVDEIRQLVEWSLSAVLFYETKDLNFGRHVELMKPWQLVPFAKASNEDDHGHFLFALTE